ncbi:MAG TPA: DUF6152 family protein [Terriglobia bacterium]|nr:DUF6152 family protein [Terriglobia bacterium]
MRPRLAWFIGLSIFPLVCASVTILGHHGSAGYNSQKRMTLTGVVTRIEWVNPHSFIYIDVKDGKGRAESWAIEGNPPSVLLRSGWTKETLMPGIEITVIGSTARERSPEGHAGTFGNLDQALAYSPDAVAHLKAAHILQAGEIRFSGRNRPFGMGPRFSAAR